MAKPHDKSTPAREQGPAPALTQDSESCAADGIASPSIRLLVDGKEAFPELIELFREARDRIDVNMFIWRDDEIGNRLAREALDAAERGVEVHLSVDRYGTIFEHSEESRRSFFHKRLSPYERLQIVVMKALYYRYLPGKGPKDEESELYRALLGHPKVKLDVDRNRYDHSKFYVFDGKTLVLGGINIEDKENGADLRGYVYGDYMVRFDGAEIVDAFLAKREGGQDPPASAIFGMNLKRSTESSPALFEMERRYLELIDSSQRELTIIMAYFSPVSSFLTAIEKAVRRGVNVRILIPTSANVQDTSNKHCMAMLLKRCGNGQSEEHGSRRCETSGSLRVFLSPRMLHTKLMMSERCLSFGSTNINKKAFKELDELNCFLPCPESGDKGGSDCGLTSIDPAQNQVFWDKLYQSIEDSFAEAREIRSPEELSYHRLLARIESLIV